METEHNYFATGTKEEYNALVASLKEARKNNQEATKAVLRIELAIKALESEKYEAEVKAVDTERAVNKAEHAFFGSFWDLAVKEGLI